MRTGKLPFIPAEIRGPDGSGATIRYETGFNCSGTSQQEVLMHVVHLGGTDETYVIMRGISRTKAAAIAMILNAPEV